MKVSKSALLMCLTFCFCLSIEAHAQSTWDGDFWMSKPRDFKLTCLVGWADGRSVGVNQAAEVFGTNVLDPRIQKLASKVTVGQILEGLDEFYLDWRNTKILVRDATEYVVMQAEGKDTEDRLRILRQYSPPKK